MGEMLLVLTEWVESELFHKEGYKVSRWKQTSSCMKRE